MRSPWATNLDRLPPSEADEGGIGGSAPPHSTRPCENYALSQREIMRRWPNCDCSPCPNEAIGYTISDHGHLHQACKFHLDEIAGPPWHATVHYFDSTEGEAYK